MGILKIFFFWLNTDKLDFLRQFLIAHENDLSHNQDEVFPIVTDLIKAHFL